MIDTPKTTIDESIKTHFKKTLHLNIEGIKSMAMKGTNSRFACELRLYEGGLKSYFTRLVTKAKLIRQYNSIMTN